MNVNVLNVRIRPMRPDEEPQVRALAAVCHPGSEPFPEPWYFAYPTLVAVDESGEVVAFANYGLNLDANGKLGIFLQDTCVAPHARGQRLASRLMEARLDIGSQMGAHYAMASAEPGNDAMRKVLARHGFVQLPGLVPGFYTTYDPPRDAYLYFLRFP